MGYVKVLGYLITLGESHALLLLMKLAFTVQQLTFRNMQQITSPLLCFYVFILKTIFVYLAVPGLNCGM